MKEIVEMHGSWVKINGREVKMNGRGVKMNGRGVEIDVMNKAGWVKYVQKREG